MKLREASPSLNCERLAQRVATLEGKLLQAMERIAKLEEENGQKFWTRCFRAQM
jgi:hypothetical protein